MGFLQRSKPAAVTKDLNEDQNDAGTAHGSTSRSGAEQRRSISIEGSKTGGGRNRNSLLRPKKAATTGQYRMDPHIPGQPVEIRAGDDVFSFPTSSPLLPSNNATSQPSPPAMATKTVSSRAASGPSQDSVPVPQRPKLKKKHSGWKGLGGIFGRKSWKPEPEEESSYKLKHPHTEPIRSRTPEVAANVRSPLPPSSSSTQGSKKPPRAMTRGMARLEARAEGDMASFEPKGKAQKARSPSMIQKDSSSPMFRQMRDWEEAHGAGGERNDSPLSTHEKSAAIAVPRRLDVSLPNPTFDRYSVMFEKLLDDSRPSLRERRQSKLLSKKSLMTPKEANEDSDAVSYDNVNPAQLPKEPHMTKSLSINVGKNSHRSMDVTSSNPTNRPQGIQRSATAPMGATSPFAQGFTNPKAPALGHYPNFSENSLPPTPQTSTTLSDRDSITIFNTNTVTPLQRKMYPAEPNDQPNPYRRVRTPEDLERQMVQVSVARQVSVSKARSQVRQAVSSKQPLRPRVVNLSKDRKSTVVLIEGEDGYAEQQQQQQQPQVAEFYA